MISNSVLDRQNRLGSWLSAQRAQRLLRDFQGSWQAEVGYDNLHGSSAQILRAD